MAGKSFATCVVAGTEKAGMLCSRDVEILIGCVEAIVTGVASCIEPERPAPQFEQNLA